MSSHLDNQPSYSNRLITYNVLCSWKFSRIINFTVFMDFTPASKNSYAYNNSLVDPQNLSFDSPQLYDNYSGV